MNSIKAAWQNGRIVPDGNVNWPEGCRLRIERDAVSDLCFMTEDEQGEDPESVVRWLQWYDSLQPLELTPAEEAEHAAWRRQLKE